jgi:outer membrane receptor protein involved in Fe transport
MPLRPDLAMAAVLCIALPTTAQAATPMVSFGPGTLGNAIIALGAQTGASIGIRDQRLASLPVPRVSGRISTGEALRRLLRNLPAEARRVPGGGWLIVAKSARASSRSEPDGSPLPAPPVRRDATHSSPPETDPVEIVITASKRDIAIEAMPASVSVIGGDQLLAGPEGANGAAIAGKAVSVSSTHFGSGRNKLFVRGIADSGFSGPTQSTVGQYLGEARINYSAPDPDLRLHDLRAVEILEGPQGTLYGAGSLGGIIKAVPTPPDYAQSEGRMIGSLSLTQHGKPGYEIVGIANLPLVNERIAVRANGYSAVEGGYIDDPLRRLADVNRTTIRGGRASLGARLGEDWEATATAVYQHIDARDAQYAERAGGEVSRRSQLAQPFRQNYWLSNLRVSGDLGQVRVVGLLGLVNNRSNEVYDASQASGVPSRFVQQLHSRIITGEARASYRGGNIGALTGLSFVSATSRSERQLDLPDTGQYHATAGNRLREWTLFGELSYDLTRQLQVTLGGRVSSINLLRERDDQIQLPANFWPGSAMADEIAPRDERFAAPSAALLYRISPRATAFVRYQEGYRPGGLALEGGAVFAFSNDSIRTVETGLRIGRTNADLVSGQLAFAASDWDNIQADIADGIGLPVTVNIGNGQILTASAQLAIAPSPRFSLEAALLFNHSRLEAPSLRVLAADSRAELAEGRSTLPNVADVNARLTMRYGGDISANWSWDVNASLRYTGRSRLGLGNRFDRDQGGFFQSNLVLRFNTADLSLFASLANLANDRTSRFAVGNPFSPDIGTQYVPQRPRSVTFGVDYSF